MDQCIARRKLLEPEIRAWLTGSRAGMDKQASSGSSGAPAQKK
jgi:hypothetical protein